MEAFIVIAENWGHKQIIGVFGTESDALAAIEEVQTWQGTDYEDDEPYNVYECWYFKVHRCQIGEILVAHPSEE